MSEGLRLSKCLSRLVSCSRREAELYIKGGWVRVDGEVQEEPHFKVFDQQVELHPQAKAEVLDPATIVLHQAAETPPDQAVALLTPATRAALDASGVRVLKSHFTRLTQVLPLQAGAGGLVAFTQDWRVLRKLTEDAGRFEQEYNVEVAGELASLNLDGLKHGLSLDGQALPPARVSWQSEARLRFAIKNPHPGQIRYACEQAGLTVLGMKRIRIGRVSMARLPPGQWRYVDAPEQF